MSIRSQALLTRSRGYRCSKLLSSSRLEEAFGVSAAAATVAVAGAAPAAGAGAAAPAEEKTESIVILTAVAVTRSVSSKLFVNPSLAEGGKDLVFSSAGAAARRLPPVPRRQPQLWLRPR